VVGRIVEVAEDRRHLFVSRGFFVVQESAGERRELGQVPLDDILAVIANAHGLSYTNNLLVALAERGVPFVLCSGNHNAVAMLWPVDGNFQQAKRFDAQIAAKKPTNKRLWAELVRSKLEHQAGALASVGSPSAPLTALMKKVRSGDPENIEAQGARRYWGLMFGGDFRRDRDGGGINMLLNYGYTVLRAATARSVIAAGLHPTLGLHHLNEGNPMRLVDDLMEPFRPVVDLRVWKLTQEGIPQSMTPDIKRMLARSLYADMVTSVGITPLIGCLQRLAVSLAQVYLGECTNLDLPRPSGGVMTPDQDYV
jgi:CRISPR-associated protein Cas1